MSFPGLPRTDGFTPLWRRGRWLCLTAILVKTLFSQVRRCLLTSRAKQHNNYTKKRIWSDSAVIDVPHTRGHLTSSAPEPQAAPCAATPAAPRFSPMLPKAPAFRWSSGGSACLPSSKDVPLDRQHRVQQSRRVPRCQTTPTVREETTAQKHEQEQDDECGAAYRSFPVCTCVWPLNRHAKKADGGTLGMQPHARATSPSSSINFHQAQYRNQRRR